MSSFLRSIQIALLTILMIGLTGNAVLAQEEPTKEEKKAQKEKEKEAKEKAKQEKKDDKAFAKSKEESEMEDMDDAGGEGDETSTNWGVPFDGASIQAGGGFSWYHGDLAPYKVFPKPGRTKWDYDNKETKPYKEHFQNVIKANLQREIIWGLGAGFQFQKGNFRSGRQNGKYATPVSFQTNFYDIALYATLDLNKTLFKKNPYRRLWFQAFAGGGVAWYRTYEYYDITGNIKTYYGYKEIDRTIPVSQKQLLEKDARLRTWTVPVGVHMGWRLNYKTDIVLSYTFTNTFTDYMDGWVRDWTAKDKYSSLVLGVRFNMNRDPNGPYAVHKKERKKRQEDADSADMDSESSGDVNRDGILNGLFKGNASKKEKDELLDLRLKLFETQLKLFEMQYLLQDGGK